MIIFSARLALITRIVSGLRAQHHVRSDPQRAYLHAWCGIGFVEQPHLPRPLNLLPNIFFNPHISLHHSTLFFIFYRLQSIPSHTQVGHYRRRWPRFDLILHSELSTLGDNFLEFGLRCVVLSEGGLVGRAKVTKMVT